jgi:hypothetical protein
MRGRDFTRVSHSVGASIRYDNSTVTCKISNLSIGGMYLKTDFDLPLHAPVNVTVHHLENSLFKVNASVVRKEPDGVGLQISSLSADSFMHLRDIVTDKSCDSNKVMQETFRMLKCIY